MINSNYGIITFGPLYVGWNNVPHHSKGKVDCGDEAFGLALWCLYVGHYSGSGWCGGILNEYEALDNLTTGPLRTHKALNDLILSK